MDIDIRSAAAYYYDYNPDMPQDIPFYIEHLPSPRASVLELGCGTGRVTLPLSQHCASLYGIDLSPAMIAICREKLHRQGIPSSQAWVEIGDITDLDLGQTYDFIIAPFRVTQNLESDEAVSGLFESVHRHLAPGGTCILNVFNPKKDPETLRRDWCSGEEILDWEAMIDGYRVVCYDKRARIDSEKLILYPELIYRRYDDQELIDEAILKIAMRCYYPEQFQALIEAHGFHIMNRWGGYAGEPYGEGSELVIQFQEGAKTIN